MKNYKTAINEIYDLQKFAIKLGLENIRAICTFLENPQSAYPVIHVAGTNGKGSTSFFIARILESMGLKVGLFTSPHLVDFRERITVNGRQIEQSFIIGFWENTKNLILKRKATFFDTSAALAFDYFRQNNVDIAVIETGLGGRLDSTNVVEPQMAVITPVHFDHEKQLGNSLSLIAAEKAGIIKPGCAVFCAHQDSEALGSIKEHLYPDNRFFYFDDHISTTIHEKSLQSIRFTINDLIHRLSFENLISKQIGDFQADNIALAYFVSRLYLRNKKILFSEEKFRDVLLNHIWPGRLQVLSQSPDLIFDVSHNKEGIQKTLNYVSNMVKKERLHILTGLVQDKDYQAIVSIMSDSASEITITEPDTIRRLDGHILQKTFTDNGKETVFIKDFQKAFDFSKNRLNSDDTLLVIGSHYLIGALLNRLFT